MVEEEEEEDQEEEEEEVEEEWQKPSPQKKVSSHTCCLGADSFVCLRTVTMLKQQKSTLSTGPLGARPRPTTLACNNARRTVPCKCLTLTLSLC